MLYNIRKAISGYQWQDKDYESTQIYRHGKVHIAAFNGLSIVVKHLLVSTPDVEIMDADGHTPLWYAASRGHTETVKVLLKHDNAMADLKD